MSLTTPNLFAGRLLEATSSLLCHHSLECCDGAKPEVLSELLPVLQKCSTCCLHRTITDLPVATLKSQVSSTLEGKQHRIGMLVHRFPRANSPCAILRPWQRMPSASLCIASRCITMGFTTAFQTACIVKCTVCSELPAMGIACMAFTLPHSRQEHVALSIASTRLFRKSPSAHEKV